MYVKSLERQVGALQARRSLVIESSREKKGGFRSIMSETTDRLLCATFFGISVLRQLLFMVVVAVPSEFNTARFVSTYQRQLKL
jgi:hypothetical protein